MSLHHCLNILWCRHWVTLTNLFFAESITNWLSDERLIRNWSSMGISAVTHQKKCRSKIICALQTYSNNSHFKLGTWTNGFTSHCSENMQLSFILKRETDAQYLEKIIRENPALITQYLNVSLEYSGTSLALPKFTILLNLSTSQCLYLHNTKTRGKYRVLKSGI